VTGSSIDSIMKMHTVKNAKSKELIKSKRQPYSLEKRTHRMLMQLTEEKHVFLETVSTLLEAVLQHYSNMQLTTFMEHMVHLSFPL